MAEATADTKGIAWLAEQVEAKLKQTVEPTKLRIILRKLVADGTVERGEGRWAFTGLKDPAVVAVFAAVKEGAAADKPAAKPAAKKAAAPAKKAAPAKRTSRKKPAPEPEPEVDDEVLDDDELDLD
ncbi:helix-turn-helix DNA binding domain protein [Gordonia phage Nodigi]|nr:helix-turn-helix DNA binding domain protein [Gordonia phage Nodigi]